MIRKTKKDAVTSKISNPVEMMPPQQSSETIPMSEHEKELLNLLARIAVKKLTKKLSAHGNDTQKGDRVFEDKSDFSDVE